MRNVVLAAIGVAALLVSPAAAQSARTREQERIEGRAPVITWHDDDYAVLDYEIVIGRIYRELVPAGVKWRWFLHMHPRIAAARTSSSTGDGRTGHELRNKPVAA